MTSTYAPSRLYIPVPFAESPTDHIDVEATASENLNFENGFPDAYSASNASGGKFVTRKEINALGYLATVNEYQKACGGVVSFDPATATKIGGYPQGAILEWVDDLVYYRVISLVDNNLIDFRGLTDTTEWPSITNGTIDGVNWAYATMKGEESTDTITLASVDLGEVDAVTKMPTIQMNAASFVTPRSGAVSVYLTLGSLVDATTTSSSSVYVYTVTMYYRKPGLADTAKSSSIVLVSNSNSESKAAEAVRLPVGTLCSIILSFGNIHFSSVKLTATMV